MGARGVSELRLGEREKRTVNASQTSWRLRNSKLTLRLMDR